MTEKWSQAEVDAHNLRVCKANQIPVAFVQRPTEGVADESELHADILAECRRRGWLCVRSRMDRKTTTDCGVPDFLIIRDKEQVLFVECKTRVGKLTVAQNAWHAHARKLGVEVSVVRDFAQFLALL